jgi:DNA-binding CsgD family transcriptional regulator
MLREAHALLAADPAGAEQADPDRVRVANDLGRVLVAQGDYVGAARWLDEALDLARRLAKPAEEAFALAKLGLIDVAGGRVAAGLARLDQALARLPAAAVPLDRATGIYYAGVRGLELARENARALEWLALAGAYCERHGAAAHIAINDALRASVERRRGRAEDALAVATRAVATLRAAKRAEVREALRVAGDLHRVRGDAGAAWQAYDEAVRLGDRESEVGAVLLLGDAERAGEAAARADRALDDTPPSHHLLRMQLLALAVHAHVADGAFADAHARLESLRAHAGATDYRGAAPLLASAEASVAGALDAPHAAVPHLEAAADGWAALGRPLEHAQALAALARALADGGDPPARAAAVGRDAAARLTAAGALGEAARLRRQLRRRGVRLRPDPAAAVRPAPADVAPHGLTVREREVLAQLATGRTNKEIGRALGIAEKTVRIHVSHVLAKLGCATRTEAAGVAFASGLGAARPAASATAGAAPRG